MDTDNAERASRQNMPEIPNAMDRSLKSWSIAMGIGLIILGLFTIAIAGFTTFVTVLFIGIVMAVRGILDVFHAIGNRHDKGFWRRIFGGTLSLVIGTLIITRPGIGVLTLTFLIAVFLITSGLYRTIAAPVEHGNQWGWVMFGGIISLVLGFMVLARWPVSAIWFIGLLVGVEILLQGLDLMTTPYRFAVDVGKRREIPVH